MRWFLVVSVVLAIVLGLGGWIGYSFFSSQRHITTTSDVPTYGLRITNSKDLNGFLEFRNFWAWRNEFTNYNHVEKLVVSFTEKPQLLNTERVGEKTVGSVGTQYKNGVLSLLVQSDPSVWPGADRNWHIEAQFLRFINGHSQLQKKWDDVLLFQHYRTRQPLFFTLYEK